MARAIKFAVVAICLLCILAVCIAPLVDLPATTLRAYQAVAVLLWGLIAIAFSLLSSSLKPLIGFAMTSFRPVRRKMEWHVDVPMKLSSVQRC